jgi:hypothetical protein
MRSFLVETQRPIPEYWIQEGARLMWRWSRATLHRYLLRSEFTFSAHKFHYEHTKERPDNVLLRENYLKWVEKYRNEGRVVFYQEETWIFKNMTQSNVWQEEGGEIIYKVPSGSGDRAIVSHLGSSETGLLEGCLLLYNGTKSNQSADYHTEINSAVFLDCLEKVFPAMVKLGRKCVFVLDRAKYHTMLTAHTKPMRKSYNKPVLIEALKRWGEVPEDWSEN